MHRRLRAYCGCEVDAQQQQQPITTGSKPSFFGWAGEGEREVVVAVGG
jgi:hypothetical protein